MRLETRSGKDKRIADCLTSQDTLPKFYLSSSSSTCGCTRTSGWTSLLLVLLLWSVTMISLRLIYFLVSFTRGSIVKCLSQVGRRDTRLDRVPNRRYGWLNRQPLVLPKVGYRTLFSLPLPFPLPLPLPFAGRSSDAPRLPHWVPVGVGSHGGCVPRP